MNKLFLNFIYVLSIVLIASCSKSPSLEKMERIKIIGNENPTKALAMLDSIEMKVRGESKYVRSKYDLLNIRLCDKSDIKPTSDFKIKELVAYFEGKGTDIEKQEVYYYAGSVYRDLQDTPRALEYFFKSLDYTSKGGDCDSMMLRNTYSNINYLQYGVQNYSEALSSAKEEARISEELGLKDVISYIHVGTSYKALDSVKQAVSAFNKSFNLIVSDRDKSEHQEALVLLLYYYSELRNIKKAEMCKRLIEGKLSPYLLSLNHLALARYYEECGKRDSAIVYCNNILNDGSSVGNMYDASKQLYHLYSECGDVENACRYAEIFMQMSDSLDFVKRQELASTVNNAYKYHLDQEKEQNLEMEKQQYKTYVVTIIFISIATAAICFVLYTKRKNRHLQEISDLSSELKRITYADEQLRKEIKNKETELLSTKDSLAKSTEELRKTEQEYESVNAKLYKYNEELKAKEQQLSEKIEQNKMFIKLLHKSELENTAEDVILTIKQSSSGRKDMSASEWKQLYNAVDELYPNFRNLLLERMGSFTEQQMQVCYLMRIGLAKPQIQNMTNLSRVTVWRWVKKYEWVLTS